MCILFLYLNDNPQNSPFKMIVASNRDEYINRPADSAAFRGNTTQWVGGKYGPRQANLVLIAYASSEGSGEPAHPRSLARTFAARSYKQ